MNGETKTASPPAVAPSPKALRAASATIDTAYLTREAARTYLADHSGNILGLVCHGVELPFAAPEIPLAPVAMAQFGDQPMVEVWSASQPVSTGRRGNIAWAKSADTVFGCFRGQTPGMGLEADTAQAYRELFDLLDAFGMPKLLRVWNYFPAINGNEADGLERYKHFCIGRHNAFAQYGRLDAAEIPAATAVGSRGGEFVLYFLAASRAGDAVENDRQVSAYAYPPQYGPRSPLFSRATHVSWLDDPVLFISGTASIVGHASTGLGDATRQTEETLDNIRRLLGQAFSHADFGQLRALKAYVRHERDFPSIRAAVENALGRELPCMYLLADICRSELLVEIEAIAGKA